MRRFAAKILSVALSTASLIYTQPAVACMAAPPQVARPDFLNTIQLVENMPQDADLQMRASQHGLQALNVMWEDTGRNENSSVGPNISDLTLQIRNKLRGGGESTHLLPVIRFPNFTDKTGDVAVDKLFVRVGNHKKGGDLTAVPLKEVLANLREYLTDPTSLKGKDDFMASRDSHFLVSAQHVFLPLPATGKVEFNPVIYNYQSYPGAPAVLTLLITREGLSATVLENRPQDQSPQGWGQELFFNKAGQRTAFTAERKSAVKARIESQGAVEEGDQGALQEGADMMMIVQVPLQQPRRERAQYFMMEDGMAPAASKAESKGMALGAGAARRRGSDVEAAVLGHGKELGKFEEMRGLSLKRDERFPVRVTIQFYKGTSNGVVSDSDLTQVSQTINKVYSNADYVGSLVVPDGKRMRPTDWIKDRPAAAWGLVSK